MRPPVVGSFFLHLSAVDSLDVLTLRNSSVRQKKGKREVMRQTVLRKPGFVFVPPSAMMQNVKRNPEVDLAELPKTASLEQVTNLMREIQQQDVYDMEVDLAEKMWQEADATVWNTLAMNWKQRIECVLTEEDDFKDIEMPGDELRDGSEVVEQEPMEDGEQRDGSVTEHAGRSKALMKPHVHFGHQGVKEMIRVLKHGRASELATQEARRMLSDVCAKNVQAKLPRPPIPRQVLDFNDRLGFDIF